MKNFGSQNLLPVRSGKFKMTAENNDFLNNSRTNGQFFKIPTAYVHYRFHAHVKNIGPQNLLPVRSRKFKMAAKTTFSWITRELMNRFSKFQRHMISIDSMHMWKMLVLKIYFRFARENSKWSPKTTFSWITRDLMDGISKLLRHMLTKDSIHIKTCWFSKCTSDLLGKFKMTAKNNVFFLITRDLMDGFSKFKWHMFTWEQFGPQNILPIYSESRRKSVFLE